MMKKSTIATVLVGAQAVLILVAGLALVATGRRHHRFVRRFLHETLVRHPRLWGLILLIVVAALIILAAGISSRRSWAPAATYITEGTLAVASLLRFHPLRSLLGTAIAVAVILLVAGGTGASQPSASAPGPTPG